MCHGIMYNRNVYKNNCYKCLRKVVWDTKVKCRFQEDGSFIGQYGTLRKQKIQQQVANAAAAAAAARASAQAQAIGPGTYV